MASSASWQSVPATDKNNSDLESYCILGQSLKGLKSLACAKTASTSSAVSEEEPLHLLQIMAATSIGSQAQDSDAWALLALKDSNNHAGFASPTSASSSTSPSAASVKTENNGAPVQQPIAKIQGKEFEKFMVQDRILIGRNR